MSDTNSSDASMQHHFRVFLLKILVIVWRWIYNGTSVTADICSREEICKSNIIIYVLKKNEWVEMGVLKMDVLFALKICHIHSLSHLFKYKWNL